MKILLLNNGGFSGMENVAFPVEVDAEMRQDRPCPVVSNAELARIGCRMQCFNDPADPFWPFDPDVGECEVIEE